MKKHFKIVKVEKSKLKQLLDIEPKLAQYLSADEDFYFRITPNHFDCIVHTIISQQLSNAVVDRMWNKTINRFKKLSAKTIAEASLDTLRDIGFSNSKIKSLKQISYDIVDKKLNLKRLEKLPDSQIYDLLTKYHGIGRWSVDMLLIFSYYRNNIISFGDFGIRKAIKILYDVKEADAKIMQMIVTKFDGMLTLFGLVLWKIANNN